MIDYPLARLQGAIDAGATLTIRTLDGHVLRGTLRSRGGTEIHAEGADLATLASEIMSLWFIHNGLTAPADNGHGPLRPHMRAALGELGARHGAIGAPGYQARGCDCDYCSAFDVARAELVATESADDVRPR